MRSKISQTLKARWMEPEFREKVIDDAAPYNTHSYRFISVFLPLSPYHYPLISTLLATYPLPLRLFTDLQLNPHSSFILLAFPSISNPPSLPPHFIDHG